MLFWENILTAVPFSLPDQEHLLDVNALECPIAHNDTRETAQGRLPWFDNGMNNKNGNLGTSAYWKRDTQPKMTHAKDIKWLRYFKYLSYLGGVVMNPYYIRCPNRFARNFAVTAQNTNIDSHLFYHITHLWTRLRLAHISRNIDSFCDLKPDCLS